MTLTDPSDAEPFRVAYSLDEATAKAKEYLVATYGVPRELAPEDKDRFMERLGLIYSLFVEMYSGPDRAVAVNFTKK